MGKTMNASLFPTVVRCGERLTATPCNGNVYHPRSNKIECLQRFFSHASLFYPNLSSCFSSQNDCLEDDQEG